MILSDINSLSDTSLSEVGARDEVSEIKRAMVCNRVVIYD